MTSAARKPKGIYRFTLKGLIYIIFHKHLPLKMRPNYARVFSLWRDLYFALLCPARVRLYECCSPQNNMRKLKQILAEWEWNSAKNHLQRTPLHSPAQTLTFIYITLNEVYNLKTGVCKYNAHYNSIINETCSPWKCFCFRKIILSVLQLLVANCVKNSGEGAEKNGSDF